MSIIKTLSRALKQEKERFTIPRSVQDAIPIRRVWPDGIFQSGSLYSKSFRFLYKGIIIKHNKTEPTYTKTSLFLCEKRRFFMARTEKGVVATI